MNKIVSLLFIFHFLSFPSFSQLHPIPPDKLIVCDHERNSDKTISIYANSRTVTEYTVKLNFRTLIGYTSSTAPGNFRTIGSGRSLVTKLTPENGNTGGNSYNYTYNYYPGKCLNQMPDTGNAYLLPAMPGSTLRIANVTSLEERIGQKRTEEFHTVGFTYKKGDTICAARAGTVYESNNDAEEGEKRNQTFSHNRNNIAIEQRDGTLARYTMLAPVKLLVAPGEEVIPGQPLAIFDKESEKYEVFLAVFYLDEKRLVSGYMNPDHPDKPAYYFALPLHFFIGGKDVVLQVHNTYVVTHPKEVVGAELSKKEKRKFGLY